jgi:hypothetical protein
VETFAPDILAGMRDWCLERSQLFFCCSRFFGMTYGTLVKELLDRVSYREPLGPVMRAAERGRHAARIT